MITVKPFAAIRPTRDKAPIVGTRSYLDYNNAELRDKLNNNPYTFLHVINPDYNQRKKLSGQEKFQAVRSRFEDFLREGILVEDETPAFYIYQQATPSHLFTGILAATSVKDYLEGRIKKHEHTLKAREELFRDYLQYTGINAEPVLLFYPDKAEIDRLLGRYMRTRADYEFSTTDRSMHQLWPVTDKADIQIIEKQFAKLDALYIADGHHRCSSSALLAQSLSADDSKHPAHFFMSYLISESSLRIHEFNRLVKTLNGNTPAQLLKKLTDNFLVNELNVYPKPQAVHEISMYLDGRWYGLKVRPGSFNPEDPVESLDYEILSKNILGPLLGIDDLRTSNNTGFLPGTEGPEGIEKAVNAGKYEVGFCLFPVTVEQLKKVADANLVMPPKSTYVEPKLRSGLTIYKLGGKNP